MKIWIMESKLGSYKSYHLQNESDIEIIEKLFDKGKEIDNWLPIAIKSLDENIETCDNPYFWAYPNILMVSENAKNIIANYYTKYIQFLPVECIKDNQTFYMGNIMNLLDGIDNEKSEFKKLLKVHIVDVIKYVLKDKVKDVPIFRLYLQGVLMKTKIFVNDDFKRLMEINNLKGFSFTEIFNFESSI